MSAIIRVTVKSMTCSETIIRMLKSRLEQAKWSNNNTVIQGRLLTPGVMWSGYRPHISYNTKTNEFTFDGDYRASVEARLSELYQIEQAKMLADSIGCPYTETIDANTGQVTLVVEDVANQFQMLETA